MKKSHDLADRTSLFLILLEEIIKRVEAELLRHEKLKLEAEIHIMVYLLQPAVFFEVGPEGLSAELALHELLDFDKT